MVSSIIAGFIISADGNVMTYVQYFGDESVAGLHVRPGELGPECLDLQEDQSEVSILAKSPPITAHLHEDGADIHGGAAVLHQVVHGAELVQLHGADDALHGCTNQR